MKNINIDIVHEELFKQKPLLAFSKDVDYPLWKKQIEEKLISLLGIEEIKKNACELNFEIDEILDKETYKRILFYFESQKTEKKNIQSLFVYKVTRPVSTTLLLNLNSKVMLKIIQVKISQ